MRSETSRSGSTRPIPRVRLSSTPVRGRTVPSTVTGMSKVAARRLLSRRRRCLAVRRATVRATGASRFKSLCPRQRCRRSRTFRRPHGMPERRAVPLASGQPFQWPVRRVRLRRLRLVRRRRPHLRMTGACRTRRRWYVSGTCVMTTSVLCRTPFKRRCSWPSTWSLPGLAKRALTVPLSVGWSGLAMAPARSATGQSLPVRRWRLPRVSSVLKLARSGRTWRLRALRPGRWPVRSCLGGRRRVSTAKQSGSSGNVRGFRRSGKRSSRRRTLRPLPSARPPRPRGTRRTKRSLTYVRRTRCFVPSVRS